MKNAAAGIGLFTIVPSYVLGGTGRTAPSSKLNLAAVGVGGMGKVNIHNVAGTENIVALCDVDWEYARETFETYPQAKRFKDYRQMLDEMEDQIDAVIVATPDHTHACVAMEAIRRKKHVYVQKPLTHSVYEARVLTRAARQNGVVTQMGNQGHSGEGIRLICEWIWDGAIGDVREVHAWTNRPVWPQGMAVPKESPPVPDSLDWNLWLGPAPYRDYHPAYHPWDWRAWVPFGTGALGDMGCHVLDPVFWALKLNYPVSVEGSYAANVVEKWKKQQVDESFPLGAMIHYEFPKRGNMPPVDVHWYDGGLMPKRPAELEAGRRMGDSEGGVLFRGDKGTLMCGCYAKGPQLIPYTEMAAYQRPPKTLPRVDTGHEMDWIAAIKEDRQPSSHFDIAGPFTEMVLMGNLCLRHPGHRLQWDGEQMKVTNFPELNSLVNPPYREGWTLERSV